MTLGEAIYTFDRERENSISEEIKVNWISQLDRKISAQVWEPRGGEAFGGYDNTNFECVLKAPEEYSEIYVIYLMMQTELMNGEITRYNNSAILFNRLYGEMCDFVNRMQPVKKNTKIKAGEVYV